MTTDKLAEVCSFKQIVTGQTRQIESVFCGDLLSWAMGRAKENDAWCTVMGNVNTIAVATLADCSCVVLCHDSMPDEMFLEKAKQQGVNVFTTQKTEFEACVEIALALGIVQKI